jgi:hypothetical protein
VEQGNSLRRRVYSWFDVQSLYIPGVSLLRKRDEQKASQEWEVYDIPLYLPSSICRQLDVPDTLRRYEWEMRRAQASDSLETIRDTLRLRAYLDKRYRAGVEGVAANTKSQAAYRNCQRRLQQVAERYRIAYKALESLSGLLNKDNSWTHHLKPLTAQDLRPLPLGYELGEGSKSLAWIWFEVGADPSDPDALHDGSVALIVISLPDSNLRCRTPDSMATGESSGC